MNVVIYDQRTLLPARVESAAPESGRAVLYYVTPDGRQHRSETLWPGGLVPGQRLRVFLSPITGRAVPDSLDPVLLLPLMVLIASGGMIGIGLSGEDDPPSRPPGPNRPSPDAWLDHTEPRLAAPIRPR